MSIRSDKINVYYDEWHDIIMIGPNKDNLWSESCWCEYHTLVRFITAAPKSAIKLIGDL